MSGGGDNVQKQTNEPSDYTKGYLTPGLDEAKTLFGEGPANYYPDSTVAGFSPETQNALGAMTQRGMGGAAGRAGSQYALDQFAGGGLGDWGAVGNLRNLGLSNNYANNPVTSRLGSMSMSGSGLGAAAAGRIGDVAQDGGNIGAYTQGQLGGIASTGGNVGGFTDSRVGDLSTGGPNTLAQFRSDVGDVISGAATGANPALASLGLTAGGAYLNSNPYLEATYDKAAKGVVRNYRTATSPGLDSAFARSSGALRSGAALNARDQAEENLGTTLGDLSTSLYGGAYGQERQLQEAAKGTQGSQYLQGLGLRTSAAGTSAGQGTADASTRLAATGQVAGDMSGDLARKMQATGQIAGDMSGDVSRRLAASQQLTGAEGQDASNQLAANAQLGSAYESGADRQLQSITAGNSAYNAGRAQQLQALGMQPDYQAMDYRDLEAATAAGQARDTQRQNEINADIARFDFGQNAPWQNIQRYLAMINGGSPGTTTSMTGGGGNPLSSILSGLGGAGSLALGLRGLF